MERVTVLTQEYARLAIDVSGQSESEWQRTPSLTRRNQILSSINTVEEYIDTCRQCVTLLFFKILDQNDSTTVCSLYFF